MHYHLHFHSPCTIAIRVQTNLSWFELWCLHTSRLRTIPPHAVAAVSISGDAHAEATIMEGALQNASVGFRFLSASGFGPTSSGSSSSADTPVDSEDYHISQNIDWHKEDF